MASLSREGRQGFTNVPPRFDPALRALKQAAFSIEATSSARFSIPWRHPSPSGQLYDVYGNVNLSLYSGTACNARCQFCVEKVRPASRGTCLDRVKQPIEADVTYFAALDKAFSIVRPLNPSISITGGEPSIDPRLPRIIELIQRHGFRKRTITTNGSGLLSNNLVPKLMVGDFKHLNISRAHPDEKRNQAIMQIDPAFSNEDLHRIIHQTRGTGLRPRLSCVLLRGEIDSIDAIEVYLEWAGSVGVDNVVFRQLMEFNHASCTGDPVITFSDARRVMLDPILHAITDGHACHHPAFTFTRQVVGYYYYIEVYNYTTRSGRSIDVVFENADLHFIDCDRAIPRAIPVVHELVFHPSGSLNSTWLPGEGIIAKLA
jgi:cyclic pyranopterin phosphate synthase